MNSPYVKKTLREEARMARKAVTRKMVGYIAAGLGLVAGLAWNDAIKQLIDYFLPAGGTTIFAKLLYAMVITLIVGLVLYYIEKSLGTEEKK